MNIKLATAAVGISLFAMELEPRTEQFSIVTRLLLTTVLYRHSQIVSVSFEG